MSRSKAKAGRQISVHSQGNNVIMCSCVVLSCFNSLVCSPVPWRWAPWRRPHRGSPCPGWWSGVLGDLPPGPAPLGLHPCTGRSHGGHMMDTWWTQLVTWWTQLVRLNVAMKLSSPVGNPCCLQWGSPPCDCDCNSVTVTNLAVTLITTVGLSTVWMCDCDSVTVIMWLCDCNSVTVTNLAVTLMTTVGLWQCDCDSVTVIVWLR